MVHKRNFERNLQAHTICLKMPSFDPLSMHFSDIRGLGASSIYSPQPSQLDNFISYMAADRDD